MRSFNLKSAFPNMESHPYDWRVDRYEPQRVWFTVRNTATHTGPLSFAGSTYKPTGKVRLTDMPRNVPHICHRRRASMWMMCRSDLSRRRCMCVCWLRSKLEQHPMQFSSLPRRWCLERQNACRLPSMPRGR